MANQNAEQDDNHISSLLVATGTQSVGADTLKVTGETIGTFQGAHVVILGTPVVSSSGGTIDLVTRLGNIGTIESGTVTVGSIGNIGQIHNAGTIAVLPDLPGGTVDLLSSIAAGTFNTLGTVGTVVGAGTVTNVGSITNIGVIHNAGTIQSARIDHRPVGSAVISTHTLGTGGGTVVGTLVAPTGAGTSLYLAGLSVVVHSGTVDCGIANNVAGTTGAGVYARGAFVPSAGIMREFNPPINVGTNGTIAYFLITAGTASFTANYWVTP